MYMMPPPFFCEKQPKIYIIHQWYFYYNLKYTYQLPQTQHKFKTWKSLQTPDVKF